jgi:hypothetical protein
MGEIQKIKNYDPKEKYSKDENIVHTHKRYICKTSMKTQHTHFTNISIRPIIWLFAICK